MVGAVNAVDLYLAYEVPFTVTLDLTAELVALTNEMVASVAEVVEATTSK